MEEVIRFAFLGFGIGALYALASQGLIVIYRGSGVLNFAMGAIGMAGVFVQWDLHTNAGWAFLPSAVVGVLFSAAIGAATHLFLMRPLRRSSPLVRVIATLGVLITLQAIAVLRYGSTPRFVLPELPTDIITISGSITITADRLILLGIAAVLTVVLWALYRFTKFGLATSAVAENERAASAIGWSPDRIAVTNWILGSALAAVAAILIAPIVTLQVTVMTNLILAAIAAALVAQFRSFPVALVAGLLIGIAQTELNRYVHQPGFGDSVPFIVIVVVLVVTGQALPLRDYFLQRLPSIGTGRINWGGIAFGVALTAFLLAVLNSQWADSIITTLCVAFILLSIVVVTGYAGQLSLAQFAIGGFGAWVAGRLVDAQGTPFWLALLIGVAATVPLGVLFAVPAVRTRGINLAVVTLGLGTAMELMLFRNPEYTGGIQGTQVGDATLFGWNINSITHSTRYGLFVLALFVICTLIVCNIRRGRSGRRLIAVRTNERAAAALGISVPGAKLYAFGVSAGIAAVGGILLVFRLSSIDYKLFTNFTSITDVGLALLGGIGYLIGPVIGATLTAGGLNQQILTSIFSDSVGKYIDLIGGVSILIIVLLNQNGIAKEWIAQANFVRRKLFANVPFLGPRKPPVRELPEHDVVPVTARTLEVRDLTVKYGTSVAVDSVSLSATPGRITGLIGPNGAGKTTLIDAVTGFTRMAGGTLHLDGQDITRWSATRRARAGIGRSFQSLELFEDSTVLDNLRVASDPRDPASYIKDLVWPVNPRLPGEVISAINEFGLSDDLDRNVEDLSYGKRRLLAIARAVATQPSVLLLDEPAAGLGDAETSELAHLVRRLADDWAMAILLVEHDMNFVMSVCDEIVVLDFGRQIAEGTPDVVRRDQGVIAAYLGEDEAQTAGVGAGGTEEVGP
ncbi:branched-chain amino acid ABC transporter permease/ATP-binding protein [Capillimicrobium parvum]|uniref:Vitamin B12 import ATP-binding protein BtuD n=1 Tax=Capillimicrobium parvum TaxID=2884022 RepID=A0A9E7C102_9ACTN|nr:branched-chain amino acid ABC transporter permease/ATP-binding protein [Capillimicrobium parvum]UGS36960.1 Vitamin B12 import ATP-binding protein BtuD [Capillimicrobium parvum]